MAPFRLDHDEYEHELPWRLMQNGPVTKYWRREALDEDVDALEGWGFTIRRLDCASWTNDNKMHQALREVFELPDYYGANLDALDDCLQDADVVDVPEAGGLAVVLDNFSGSEERNEQLLRLLADTSRWWLLFGRLVVVLLRTDDARYEGPRDLGVTPARWNDREWLDASRETPAPAPQRQP